MAAAQMNIRMDASLKSSGNAAIAKLGFTPSQVVRALWEYIVVQGALPTALASSLRAADSEQAASSDSDAARTDEGAALVSTFYQTIGIEEPARGGVNYDELRELAATEQLEKWGLS
mgnify:CR=1 FL=1